LADRFERFVLREGEHSRFEQNRKALWLKGSEAFFVFAATDNPLRKWLSIANPSDPG
jgi:hypothetical protein